MGARKPGWARSDHTALVEHPLHDPAPAGAVAERPRGRAAHVDGDRRHDCSIATPGAVPAAGQPVHGYVDIVMNPDGTVLPTVALQLALVVRHGRAPSTTSGWPSGRTWRDVQTGHSPAQRPSRGRPGRRTPADRPAGRGERGTLPGALSQGRVQRADALRPDGPDHRQRRARRSSTTRRSATPARPGRATYNATNPFIQAEQGVSGGP